jgi:hypothetical protein
VHENVYRVRVVVSVDDPGVAEHTSIPLAVDRSTTGYRPDTDAVSFIHSENVTVEDDVMIPPIPVCVVKLPTG